MKTVFVLTAALLVAVTAEGCSKPAEAPSAPASAAAAQVPGLDTGFPAPAIDGLPAGDYALDPMHSSLTFRLNHMGFSHYTARFAKFEAHLKLDPAHPEQATLTAGVDPQSLTLNAPPKGFHDDLMGKTWLDVAANPKIGFVSTAIEKTGDHTARVTGTLTLKGISKPVMLDVAFNGGYPGMDLDPHARIGFTATGHFNRSDFGMGFGVAPPNSHMGVSDDVEFVIDSEFTGPAFKKAGA